MRNEEKEPITDMRLSIEKRERKHKGKGEKKI